MCDSFVLPAILQKYSFNFKSCIYPVIRIWDMEIPTLEFSNRTFWIRPGRGSESQDFPVNISHSYSRDHMSSRKYRLVEFRYIDWIGRVHYDYQQATAYWSHASSVIFATDYNVLYTKMLGFARTWYTRYTIPIIKCKICLSAKSVCIFLQKYWPRYYFYNRMEKNVSKIQIQFYE